MKPELIEVTVNGDVHYVPCSGLTSLAEVIRDDMHITSVKIGCGEGYCGSCTVLVDGEPMVSCLLPAVMCDGRTIQTIDEPGSLEELQMALQRELYEADAIQCGMCIPGIVVLVSSLIELGEIQKSSDITPALVGSICRCSGYSRIVSAIERVLLTHGLSTIEMSEV